MGIIINKKIDYDLYPDLLEQLGIDKPLDNKKLFIRYGGPVESGRGFVLHSSEYSLGDETLKIGSNFGMTASFEVLEELAKREGPKSGILMLGYSGWGPGQIEDEISLNGWLVCDADPDLVFSSDTKNKWLEALKLIGVDPLRLSSSVGRA